MTAVSPGASLPLSGSTVVWIFLLWPGRLGGIWSVIFAERAGPTWVWDRDARSIALWIESCFEAEFVIKGDGFSGIVIRSISIMDLQQWATVSSQPDGLVTLLPRLW